MTTTAETVTQAVAKRDTGPAAMIAKYSGDFATVLPSHVKPDTWVRLAQGALKKGKRVNAPNPKDPNHEDHGTFELEVAARNNTGAFLAALLDAARLGLEPGSEQYYLTPRKVAGRLEILGIVGYQGHIELMYRAGAVSSVVAEVVHANDRFEYQPGRDEVPVHQIDWDADDRGPLRLVYAYARMKDGAVSKVVVLNKAAIETIKKSATAATSEYSPWVKHEASMWLKSAVRQLQKWVPTSAEYRREQARALAEAQRVAEPVAPFRPSEPDEVLDGEVVGEDWPTTVEPGSEP
jgi:recombination protein RecT